MSFFVVFEGLDKSGKATQVALTKAWLEEKKIKVTEMDFPRYQTETGKKVRAYLKGNLEFPREKAWIFWAEDQLAAKDEIKKILSEQSAVLICDRFLHSNLAFQSAKGVDKNEMIRWYTEHNLPKPNLVIFIDVSPEESRMRDSKYGADIHESDLRLQTDVREKYNGLCLENAYADSWKRVNGAQSIEKIQSDIREILVDYL